jgi:hypothetical protein
LLFFSFLLFLLMFSSVVLFVCVVVTISNWLLDQSDDASTKKVPLHNCIREESLGEEYRCSNQILGRRVQKSAIWCFYFILQSKFWIVFWMGGGGVLFDTSFSRPPGGSWGLAGCVGQLSLILFLWPVG